MRLTARFLALVLTCAAFLTAASRSAFADAPVEAQVVLAREARIYAAIDARNGNALRALLDEDYVHVTSRGAVVYRDEDVAAAERVHRAMHAASETVDLFGEIAIVGGVLSVARPLGPPERFRYTHIYRKLDGLWLLKWSQETAIAHA